MRVTVGDMTTTRVPGTASLVYLVANTIMNVTTQAEQVEVFANAAAHLEPRCVRDRGGRAVAAAVPAGETGRVFRLDGDHVGVETLDDLIGQVASSHHWMAVDGRLVQHSALVSLRLAVRADLMAQMTGSRIRERWGGWRREPFTADSTSQVAVFERTPMT